MGVDLLIEAVSNATVTLLNDRIATITPTEAYFPVVVMTTGIPPEEIGFKSVNTGQVLTLDYSLVRHGYLISGKLSKLPRPPKGAGVAISIDNHTGVEILAAGW